MGFGLVGAGMLAGLGQGITHAVDQTTAMKMQEDRDKRMMDLELMRQDFETKRDDKKLAAQKELEESGWTHREKMQGAGFAHTEKMQELQQEYDGLKQARSFGHDAAMEGERQRLARELEKSKRDSAFEIAKMSTDEAHDFHTKSIELQREELKIRASMVKVQREALKAHQVPQIREDGTLALVDPITGKATTVVDPETNKPFKGLKDLPAANKAMIDVLGTMIKSNDYIMKNPMISDERLNELKQENDVMKDQISKISGLSEKMGAASTASEEVTPAFKAWADKYFKGSIKNAKKYAAEHASQQTAPMPTPTPTPAVPMPGPTGPIRQGGVITVPRNPAEEEMMQRSLQP